MPTGEDLDLVALIAGRVDRLVVECEAGLHALEETLPSLRDARDRIAASQSHRMPSPDSAEHVGRQPSRIEDVARLQVEHSSIDELLDFQEQLARLPGVNGVSISAMADDVASLLVEMGPARGIRQPPATAEEEDEAPSVRCAVCGRMISSGSNLISHGLCPDCTDSFMRGEVAR